MDLSKFSSSEFDRGASRLNEAVWYLVKLIFFLSAVPWPSRLKRILLRCFGATIGEGVVIRPRVNITFPWRLSVGNDVWIGEETLLLSLDQITIGDSVCLSQRAFLCTGSHDFDSESFDLIHAPIHIQRGSWIASQAFIGPGVTVGENCLIAAGTVLTKSLPSGSRVGGNPAHPLNSTPG